GLIEQEPDACASWRCHEPVDGQLLRTGSPSSTRSPPFVAVVSSGRGSACREAEGCLAGGPIGGPGPSMRLAKFGDEHSLHPADDRALASADRSPGRPHTDNRTVGSPLLS